MSIGSPGRHDVSIEFATAMGGSVTLQLEDADVMFVDGGGSAQNLTLPAVSLGAAVTVVNVGGEIISVLDPGSTVVNEAVAANEIATFYSSDAAWFGVTGVVGV